MKPMATNGMAPSFFPANFLLQMQQPLPHHPQQQEHRHHHHHDAGHHEHEAPTHHLLAPPPPALVSPFLHDFGGAMAAPPMLGGGLGKRMYPDGAGYDSNILQQHAAAADPQQQDGGAGSDDEEGSAAAGGGERKRRLSVEQVRTLERSFEVANKLEPERKAQLARALGLQPRQVAIWFQNRRARWKTKQLEKDYDALRRQLDAARAENDALLAHNKKLHAEVRRDACRRQAPLPICHAHAAAQDLVNHLTHTIKHRDLHLLLVAIIVDIVLNHISSSC